MQPGQIFSAVPCSADSYERRRWRLFKP